MNDGPYRTSPYSRLRCPRCPDTGLVVRTLGHVKVDECTLCRGVWVDNRALGAIVDDLALYDEVRKTFPVGHAAPTLRELPGPMYVQCPACRDIMNRRQFAPGAKVIVDVCRGDGVWFDAGELPAVVDFVERRGAELVAAPAARPVAPPTTAPASASTAPSTFTPAASTPYVDPDERHAVTLAEVILGFLR